MEEIKSLIFSCNILFNMAGNGKMVKFKKYGMRDALLVNMNLYYDEMA